MAFPSFVYHVNSSVFIPNLFAFWWRNTSIWDVQRTENSNDHLSSKAALQTAMYQCLVITHRTLWREGDVSQLLWNIYSVLFQQNKTWLAWAAGLLISPWSHRTIDGRLDELVGVYVRSHVRQGLQFDQKYKVKLRLEIIKKKLEIMKLIWQAIRITALWDYHSAVAGLGGGATWRHNLKIVNRSNSHWY